MSNSSVHFQGLGRIIFTFQKDTRKDDKLVVEPDTYTNGYNITFLQQNINNTTTNYLSNNELMPYLNRLFRTMEYDVDSYDRVQIDCPLYPTVMIEHSNLYNYLHVLSEQIKSLQTSWPTEYSGSKYKKAMNLNSYAGEGRVYFTLIKDGRKDDVLCIRPASDGFHIWYEQNELINATEGFIATGDLISYLQRFITAVTCDSEACTHIQVDFPMYPTILLNKTDVQMYMPLLHEQIRAIDCWPSEHSGKHCNSALRREYDWDVMAD